MTRPERTIKFDLGFNLPYGFILWENYKLDMIQAGLCDRTPDIVCEWTGLKDKNSQLIYEDHLMETEHGTMQVFFIDGRFILMWPDNGTYYAELAEVYSDLVICGSIHDDKSLNKLAITIANTAVPKLEKVDFLEWCKSCEVDYTMETPLPDWQLLYMRWKHLRNK